MKKFLMILMFALFCIPWVANAQNTLTVCDGTTTNSNIPVYGYSGDTQGTTSEFVIPATTEGMSSMTGMAITSMQFYVSSAAGAAWTATFQVYMKEIDGTTLSGTTGPGNCTVVYTGTLDATGTTMTVVFDEGFTYNGGNLLIGTYVQTAGNWKSASFYGIEATGAAYQSGGYNQNGAKNFLPKTTFTYDRPSSCAKPTDLAVDYTDGATTATVSWRSEARNFNIDVNGTITAITENPYTLGGIEPATTYDIKVQADCGDEQSVWASTSFFSGCSGISVPYAYGFEQDAALDCWTVEYSDDSYAGITTNLPRTGDQCFWFYYTTTPGQYLISPAMSGFTNGLHVEFWYRGYDNGVETFQVGYSTTDNDPDSFTWGDVITATPTYTQFKANYPAETQYVAVKHLSNDQYYLFLDDFLFEESSSCLEPSSVHVADVTTTSATISWTAGASETAWDIFVTDDATVEPDETTTPTVAGTEDNPYSLTDLDPATIYYVYVRAICGEDEVSAWSSYAVFNTECNAMALPYSYDFEDETLPVCWNTIIENTSYTGINVMAPSSSSTNQVLAFYMGTYQNPALVAVLPEVDETYPLNQYQITFDACYANTSTSSMTAGKLGIGIMTDPTDFTTFELIEEVDITDGYSTFGTHNVWFNSYTGNGRYIAIRDIYTQTGYVFVDNIEVTELPSCLQVTELGVSNIGDASADLSWTANNGETEWTIYYKAEGAEEYTEVANVTENPYTLEGLTASTNYEFYVVANCSETAQSTPSEVYSFTTAMCAVADQCELTFVVTDSYGDSWNGNAIQVKDSNTGEVLATIANEDLDGTTGTEETQTITLAICDGSVIDFVWVSGSYSSETSYTVYDRNGDEIFSGSAGSGLVTGYTVDCSVPTCQKPIELAATTTATSAVLSWTAQSEETAWTIYWKENGAEEYTEVANVTENPYTLEGLTSNTAYEFYVVANCSADDVSDASAVYEFTTPCDAIVVTDSWSEDFEDGDFSICWSQDGSGTWTVGTGDYSTSTGAHDGSYNALIKHSTTGNVTKLITPVLDLTALNNPKITFWFINRDWTGDNDGFAVYYRTASDEEWTLIDETEDAHSTWTEATYMLPNPSATYQIAFEMYDNYGYGVGIDDITIEEAPSCKILVDIDNPSWIEDFEAAGHESTTAYTGYLPDCWNVVEEYTTDEENPTAPQVYYKPAFNHTDGGSYCFRMRTRAMVAMPELDEDVDFGHLRMSLYVRQSFWSYKLEIGVVTDLENPDENYTPVAVVNNSDKNVDYFECNFSSVSNLTGPGRYIVFKNVGGSEGDLYCNNYLDDITLTYIDVEELECQLYSGYEETFESYAVGTEPDCWEVIMEDATLESSTRPQVYANYNTTAGGNKSLRLKNRCIYAMPEFIEGNNVSDFTMTFQLRQPKSIYRLQVGVVDEQGVFTPVQTFKCSGTEFEEKTVDFSGQEGRIAFRNTLVPGTGRRTDYLDYSINYIDDINIIAIEEAKMNANDENVLDADLENIAVYPNPTTGKLYIDAIGVQKVECYNQMGQLVGMYDNARDIDLGSLAEGVYTLRITVPQGVTVRKVVKR